MLIIFPYQFKSLEEKETSLSYYNLTVHASQQSDVSVAAYEIENFDLSNVNDQDPF